MTRSSILSKRIPMPAVVARVRAMHAEGVALYLWSSGGAEYARAAAVELGLEGCFLAHFAQAGCLPRRPTGPGMAILQARAAFECERCLSQGCLFPNGLGGRVSAG